MEGQGEGRREEPPPVSDKHDVDSWHFTHLE